MRSLNIEFTSSGDGDRLRYLLRTVSLCCLFALATSSVPAKAQDSELDSAFLNEAERMLDFNTVELGVQLKLGLRVFLPAQEQFVDRVIVEVKSGRLSRSMVNIVYLWAQRRNPKVPFPYFEIVLRELASRRGVTL